MKAAVIVFPGSNCDRDAAVAIEQCAGVRPAMVWHRESSLPEVDLIVLPGGFSYGDYLRAGALAARSPVMTEVVARAKAGVPVLGICNGFQVLTECGLLPGAILRNAGLTFVCRNVALRVENHKSAFTRGYEAGEVVHFPVAHHDGNYRAPEDTLDRLEGEGLVAFRYCGEDGKPGISPNGAARDIAGILSPEKNVLGLMPHPERASDPRLGGTDGAKMFDGLVEVLA